MTRAPIIGLGLSVALLVGIALAPRPSSSQTASLGSFDGVWQFTNRVRDRRSLESGIDHVADQLNLFIREIARGEMRRQITPSALVRIHVESETHVSIGIDDWGPYRFQLGRPMRRLPGPNGDPIRASVSFRAGRLVEHETHGQGNRTNIFTLSGDRSLLTMAARIGSNQLPDDIRFRLTYRRVR